MKNKFLRYLVWYVMLHPFIWMWYRICNLFTSFGYVEPTKYCCRCKIHYKKNTQKIIHEFCYHCFNEISIEKKLKRHNKSINSLIKNLLWFEADKKTINAYQTASEHLKNDIFDKSGIDPEEYYKKEEFKKKQEIRKKKLNRII